MSTITPEEQARCAERVRERQACQENNGGPVVCEACGNEVCDCLAQPTLEPADELEWLREQYVVLKQQNDSLRQAYSAVGQEASALRRAMTSRMPTIRERAAIELMGIFSLLNERHAIEGNIIGFDQTADEAVRAADALIARLTNG